MRQRTWLRLLSPALIRQQHGSDVLTTVHSHGPVESASERGCACVRVSGVVAL
jgi:hypothetical protein